MNFRHNLS